jgi:hypothetical protein
MTTTYTKLRDGSWGLRADGGTRLTVGAAVTVAKRDGTTKQEVVGKILWSGDGITLATIAPSASDDSSSNAPARKGGNNRGCPECGKNRHLIYDMEDGRMKCYGCCDMPSE